MNIDQLRYFVTAARLENLSRAAEVLYVNQPTLSKNISKLEQELGTPLFDRNGKKLLLNAQGERFLEYASVILREVDLAETQIRQMNYENSERIRIGAAGCIREVLSCAADFRKRYPDCTYEFDFGIEEQEMPDINNYDVLIYPDGMKYEKFEGFSLGKEKYYLALADGHPLAGAASITVKQLSGLDYVFLRKGKYYTEFSHRVFTALKVPVQSVCFTDARETQIGIIRAGMAAGVIPDGLADSFSVPGISLVPVNSKHFTRKMKICFKREKHLSPLAHEFKEMMISTFGLDAEETDGNL